MKMGAPSREVLVAALFALVTVLAGAAAALGLGWKMWVVCIGYVVLTAMFVRRAVKVRRGSSS